MPPCERPKAMARAYRVASSPANRYAKMARPCSAEPDEQGLQPADAVGDPARHQPAHHPEPEHEREHARAVRRVEPEIEHERDDVDLGHRHRRAAAHPRDAQQPLQRAAGEPERAPAGPAPSLGTVFVIDERGPVEHEAQGQHREQGQVSQSVERRPPAIGVDEMLQHGRPYRARHVGAADHDPEREAAARGEPVGDVRSHRREGRGHAEQPAQEPQRDAEVPQLGGAGREEQPPGQAETCEQRGGDDAEAIGNPPHHDSAEAEADHEQGVRHGARSAAGAELRRGGFQDEDRGVHRRARDGHEQERGDEPGDGVDVGGSGGGHLGRGVQTVRQCSGFRGRSALRPLPARRTRFKSVSGHATIFHPTAGSRARSAGTKHRR